MRRRRAPIRRRGARTLLRLPPPALLALLYAGLIVAGTLALKTPAATHAGIGWFDALFTSTSAVTVTGLVVIDVGADLTLAGQALVAVLIQLGGLGLMTFAALVLSALGISFGMGQRMMLREDLNQTSVGNLLTLVAVILRATLVCELIGAALLALVFVPDLGLAAGLWSAAFHSISAFNNAGFSLYADSLTAWVAHPLITLVVPAMFLLGGLGFVVIADIADKRAWGRLTLHSKLMLAGTLALILWAWLTFAALEWTNPGTLGALDGPLAKAQASFFQAVTPRTAGFNTVRIAELHDATALMTIALMLIGGGSTSTAGGIKVTTFIVLILATVAFFRRAQSLHAFGRSIGLAEVMKVMALTTTSILLVMFALFAISISHDGDFLDLAFEVASAFGTVGLSRGATGELDALGRLVVIAVMFFGRVGPLTIGFFLATRSVPRVRYPPGQIHLG